MTKSTPSESCHLTAVQSRPRHQSREHRIQRHMSNLAADKVSSGQCDFVLEIPWEQPGSAFWRFAFMNVLRDFIALGIRHVRGVCELIQVATLRVAGEW